jgi:hypothetical protein
MTTTAELVQRVTDEQRLLLRAALLDRDRAHVAWREWRAAVEFDAVDEASQRLLPLFARRIDELAPDEELRGLVRGLYRHSWGRNHFLWRDVKPVFAGLRSLGIPVLLLKGLALLRAYGGDWGARPMYDIDVLVPRERTGEALATLCQQGWTPEAGATFDWIRHRAVAHCHSWGFSLGEGHVDLHWRVLLTSIGPRADDGFWANAQPLDIGGLQLRGLDSADLLLHVLLHGATSFGSSPLQWIADSVLVCRWAGAAAVADRLAEQARAHAQVDTVRAALEAVAELVDEADVEPVIDRLTFARARRIEGVVARSAGRPGREIVGQLGRHADANSGIAAGAASLANDRLDLALVERPWATAIHAATGRSAAAGRVLRRVAGMASRTAAEGYPVDDGEELVLSYPPLVDAYCGPGWSHVWQWGVVTHGSEARLVIPLGPTLFDSDIVATLEIRALRGHRRFDVFVNESRLASAAAGPEATRIRVLISAAIAGRSRPLEIALRCPTAARLSGRGLLEFQVNSIRFDRAEHAPHVDAEFY